MAAIDAGEIRPDDIEQADNADGPGGEARRDAALYQIGRQMDRHEGDLEAADEEARDQQQIAAMAETAPQCLAHRQIELLLTARDPALEAPSGTDSTTIRSVEAASSSSAFCQP